MRMPFGEDWVADRKTKRMPFRKKMKMEKEEMPIKRMRFRKKMKMEKATKRTRFRKKMKMMKKKKKSAEESNYRGNYGEESLTDAVLEVRRNMMMPLTVVTGEELEAHKSEWTEIINSDPDLELLPWKSRHGAGMDEQYPPIWKERIEECPEYEYLEGFLDDEDDEDNDQNEEYKMLIDQIRESRGYDITISNYGFCSFCPAMVRQSGEASPESTVVCKFVTDQINERAKKHEEFYVFDEVKKIVKTSDQHARQFFYTFTVKETSTDELKTVQTFLHSRLFIAKWLVYLKEWRFKPNGLPNFERYSRCCIECNHCNGRPL